MGLMTHVSNVKVLPAADCDFPRIRSFHKHQVATSGFNPLEHISKFADFLAWFQLERLVVNEALGEMSPVLEEILLIHSATYGQKFFLNKVPRAAETAKDDYRFRAAALMGMCWSESPWDPEAMEFLLLFMQRNSPEVPPVFHPRYPRDGWKIHSPLMKLDSTEEWFT